MNRLLVIDTSYCLEAIRARQLESAVLSRDLDGFFSEVWSVHPVASIVSSNAWGSKCGTPSIFRIARRHFFIEGKVGRYRFLGFAKALNLLFAQIQIFNLLIRISKQRKIKVIRAGDPLYSGLVGLVISKVTGIPLLVRVGSNNEAIYRSTGRPIMPGLLRVRTLERFIERLVLSNARMVIAANQNNLNFALSSGASILRAEVVRYGNLIHPCHLTEPRLRLKLLENFPSDIFYLQSFILYVGRLEPVKKVDHIVHLLARAKLLGHNLKLVVCGDGSQRHELENAAQRLNVASQIYFAGNRNQEWLAKIIPQAALVVSPHTGRALCEVAYGAAPVVAYDIDWQGELIEDGVTGILVPFLDQEGLLHGCIKVLNDKALGRRLGANLRKKALALLDYEKINTLERSCYLRTMSEN